MADRAEQAFFNAEPATVSRDFKNRVYFQSPNRFAGMSPDFPHGPMASDGMYRRVRSPLCCIGQTHGDDPVFLLAHRAQILPLNPGSLLPLLDETGFINDADGMGAGMFLGNDLLQAVASQIFLSTMLAEKLLERPHRNTGRQGDARHALAGQVRELAVDIDRKMRPRVFASKAVVETFQKTGKHRSQSANLLGIHAWASLFGQDISFTNLFKQSNVKLALWY